MNGRLPVAVRRRIICVVIVIALAELAAVAIGAWLIHRSGAVTFGDTFFPALAVLSGLAYLRSTRRRS